MQRLGIQVVNGGGQCAQGSSIYLTVALFDMGSVDTSDFPTTGTPNPLGPPATVTISIQSPSKQQVVSGASMTADLTNLGLFDYSYASTSTDETGLWYATFVAADGVGNVANFSYRPVFEIVTV